MDFVDVVFEDVRVALGVARLADVLVGLFGAFLDGCFADSADEALVLLVVFDGLPGVTELCESINHDTTHNITKQQLHHDHIQQIRQVPPKLQILILRAHNPRRI